MDHPQTHPELPARSRLAVQLARETGDLLLGYFQQDLRNMDIKQDLTLVTEADLKADQHIQQAVREQFPADGVVSEEGQTTLGEETITWVIDPLDGTTNFSQGLHYWGVSIAILQEGMPVFAAVNFPAVRELYTAAAGSGAALNGTPLSHPENKQGNQFSFFVHCSRTHQQFHSSLPYKTRSLGAAAYHLCLIAKGAAIFALETRTKLWDIAGSWLIIEETGGIIQIFQKNPPFPARKGINYNDVNYQTVAARNLEVMNYAIPKITPK